MATLAEVLGSEMREGELFGRLPDGRLQCYACGHCCPLPDGAIGVCKVRFNRGGRLLVPWGYVGGVQCDPIEKKPFFHAYPGALAYSFGMLGCDLHCSYCQNWVTSQALRDPAAVSSPMLASPDELVSDALRQRARVMVSTYNEPLITSEWAVAIFKEAKAAGLVTGYVSNGNGTPQVLEYIRPWVDLYKVDLKSFDDRHYRELGGRIAPILDTIRRLHEMRFWVEIVTLLIPGFNDSREELTRLTEFALCRGNTGLDGVELVEPRQRLEAIGAERIEADRDAPQSRALDRFDLVRKQHTIGRHRQVRQTTFRRDHPDKIGDIAAQERLAPGQPDLVDAE